MFNVAVTIVTTDTALPSGTIFGHTNLVSTDSAGAVQNFALNGSETPPWTQVVAGLADGTASFVAQAVDAAGNDIPGATFTGTYAPVPATFPSPTGMTFAPA